MPPTNSYTVPTGGFDAVGNIVASQDSIMGNWTYQYDVLNRLATGAASSGTYNGQNACWSYDDFGNRTMQSVQTGACSGAGSVASTLVFNAGVPADRSSSVGWNAQNQLSGVIPPGGGSQSPSTLLYDAAGDVTSDSSTGNQYVYDAEGRICAFQTEVPVDRSSSTGWQTGVPVDRSSSTGWQTPNGLGGTIMMGYLYDAEGSRVAKGTITTMTCDPATNGFAMTGNNTGTYVLGPGGQELTQLSGSGAWQRTNVFGGGKQLATYDSMGLHFQIEDALGTRRMQTNADGQPETDIQSRGPHGQVFVRGVECLPYGDALVTANDQYAPATADDATPLHFTGKERDSESGNDYFGARYYASTMGRFMSLDWSPFPMPVPFALRENPQTLNLYNYVLNNPLRSVDRTGHYHCDPDTSTTTQDAQGNATMTFKPGACHLDPGDLPSLRIAKAQDWFNKNLNPMYHIMSIPVKFSIHTQRLEDDYLLYKTAWATMQAIAANPLNSDDKAFDQAAATAINAGLDYDRTAVFGIGIDLVEVVSLVEARFPGSGTAVENAIKSGMDISTDSLSKTIQTAQGIKTE